MKQILVEVCLVFVFVSKAFADLQLSEDTKCPIPYKTYLCGFNEGNTFIELFRSCYDPENVAAKYTMHILHPPFTVNKSVSSKTLNWTTNRIITAKAAASFSNANIRSRTHETFPSYHRGHLTPAADFSEHSERQATYTYVNTVPQFSMLNGGKWKSLEYFIRSLAELDANRVTVITGALDVLKLNSQPIYLYGTNSNPIPEYLYKIVNIESPRRDAMQFYAFLAYNYMETPAAEKVKSICDILDCPNSLNGGKIYCCNATEFILQNLPTFVDYFNITGRTREFDMKNESKTSIWKDLMGNLRDLFSTKNRKKND